MPQPPSGADWCFRPWSVVHQFADLALAPAQYLASRLGEFSFLRPLFGIVPGALSLDEVIEPVFVLGTVPVMVGIVLVSGHGWAAQLLSRVARKQVA